VAQHHNAKSFLPIAVTKDEQANDEMMVGESDLKGCSLLNYLFVV
jgi:hypothetical protein